VLIKLKIRMLANTSHTTTAIMVVVTVVVAEVVVVVLVVVVSKRPGREADHSPPSSAEVHSQYNLMVWWLIN
jgi:heme/copper-type cytochrome/quinol oxidase subunit 2